jgi:hypothetical protein
MTTPEKSFHAQYDKLSAMYYEERDTALKKEPLENLEALLCVKNTPRLLIAKDAENTYKEILLEHYTRIRDIFKWTPENIKRVLALSALFSEAWGKGFAQAKTIIDTLMNHFDENLWLKIWVSKGVYNPETKDENGFRDNIHIKRDLN